MGIFSMLEYYVCKYVYKKTMQCISQKSYVFYLSRDLKEETFP